MIWHKRSKSFFPWIRLDNPENYHSESEIDYPNVLDSFTAIQVGKKINTLYAVIYCARGLEYSRPRAQFFPILTGGR